MAEQQEIKIDLSQYLEQKASGVMQLVKLNGVAHYTLKRWDAATGLAKPVLVPIDRETAAKILEDRKKDVVIFETLLSDIDAAVEKL